MFIVIFLKDSNIGAKFLVIFKTAMILDSSLIKLAQRQTSMNTKY